ncbi:SUN2 protein, partial [Halcyon senegalensis]|nr:SUN2 protein [Halcyon senegalensis]
IALAICFQPESSLGHCWPSQGSQTEVLIQMPTQIRPMAITIEQTSKTASLLGTVTDMPRKFTVTGLDEDSKEEILLGTFTYAVQKEPTQTFLLQVQGVCMSKEARAGA